MFKQQCYALELSSPAISRQVTLAPRRVVPTSASGISLIIVINNALLADSGAATPPPSANAAAANDHVSERKELLAYRDSVFIAAKKLDKPWVINRIYRKPEEMGRTGAVRAAEARHHFSSDGRHIPRQPALQVKPSGNGECANCAGSIPQKVDVPSQRLPPAVVHMAGQSPRQTAFGRTHVDVPPLLEVHVAEGPHVHWSLVPELKGEKIDSGV
jgi:hypothetical protein